ncbi:MAG: 50S ribosomal protein L22 [Spirochaetes bacterium]|nr:MAG: 50S ribosomal protein L22 [Spirochaetota bacterium]RKX96640.1 MAG: 50S ribosomal protein L22 [Spirochaetota bacterium]
MIAQAISKYVRVSPRKVNKYSKVIKEMPFREADAALGIITARGARSLRKVIKSAVSNLMEKAKNIDEETIKIESIIVNEGPTLKRWIPRARGRADRIRKRTCHIKVVVSGKEIEK